MAGWIKAWRKEVRSNIWDMPPIYHRVFLWLRYKVEHKITLFPTRGKFGIWTRPGQIITSVRNIATGVSWRENGVEKTPNVKTIKSILEWLHNEGAITLVSNTKGTFISLTNWDTYQGQEGEQVTLDGQQNGQVNGRQNGYTLRSKRSKEVKENNTKGTDRAKIGKLYCQAFEKVTVPSMAWEHLDPILAKYSMEQIEEAFGKLACSSGKTINYLLGILEGRGQEAKPKGVRQYGTKPEGDNTEESPEYASFWK